MGLACITCGILVLLFFNDLVDYYIKSVRIFPSLTFDVALSAVASALVSMAIMNILSHFYPVNWHFLTLFH